MIAYGTAHHKVHYGFFSSTKYFKRNAIKSSNDNPLPMLFEPICICWIFYDFIWHNFQPMCVSVQRLLLYIKGGEKNGVTEKEILECHTYKENYWTHCKHIIDLKLSVFLALFTLALLFLWAWSPQTFINYIALERDTSNQKMPNHPKLCA